MKVFFFVTGFLDPIRILMGIGIFFRPIYLDVFWYRGYNTSYPIIGIIKGSWLITL